MPAPSNRKKPAKRLTASAPTATIALATAISPPAPPTATSQPPTSSPTAATVTEIASTVTPATGTTTAVPTVQQIVAMSAERVAFRDFINLADIETINHFLAAATSTLESENLDILWKRAYKEGFENGQKATQPILQRLGVKLKEKFEKGVARGMDLGREEGYTVAKQGFDGIVKALRDREAQKASTTDVNTQTDSPVTTDTSISTQNKSIIIPTTKNTNSTSTIDVSAQKSAPVASLSPHTSSSIQIKHTECPRLENAAPIFVDTSQIPVMTGTEMSVNFSGDIGYSSAASVPELVAPAAVASALETRSKMVNFAPKHQKPENSPIPTQTFCRTASPSIVGPTDDVTQAYTSPETPNNILLQPPALTPRSPTASSSPTPHPTKHEKSALPHAIFESQPHTESPVPATIIPVIKTRSESANSVKNRQNIENTPNFDQKTPEFIISTRFNWAEDAAALPTLSTGPTKSPRDLSSLRSPTSPKNSFSSLQRRRQKFNKNRTHFNYSKPQYHCHHPFPGPYFHSQNRHHHSQPPFSASLNWDQDPRLLDLSNALKALGWVRQ